MNSYHRDYATYCPVKQLSVTVKSAQELLIQRGIADPVVEGEVNEELLVYCTARPCKRLKYSRVRLQSHLKTSSHFDAGLEDGGRY